MWYVICNGRYLYLTPKTSKFSLNPPLTIFFHIPPKQCLTEFFGPEVRPMNSLKGIVCSLLMVLQDHDVSTITVTVDNEAVGDIVRTIIFLFVIFWVVSAAYYQAGEIRRVAEFRRMEKLRKRNSRYNLRPPPTGKYKSFKDDPWDNPR